MDKEKIKKVFEVIDSFCDNQANCRYCPFQTLRDTCSFFESAGVTPAGLNTLISEKTNFEEQ